MSPHDSNETLIRVDRHDPFALVTLHREAGRNALDTAMVADLDRVFTELQSDVATRAIILTGTGAFFSAGLDAEELADLSPERARNVAREGQVLLNLIENLGKPVIAAVNGLAAGAGCELALACTWRIASSQATFVFPDAASGLIPAFGGTVRLSRAIGKSRALEMLLTADPINSDEALRIGLINHLVAEPEGLVPACEALAQRIGRNAPLAIKYALEAVNYGGQVPLPQGLQLESTLFGLCFATRDAREGTTAFLEKRLPDFRGQ